MITIMTTLIVNIDYYDCYCCQEPHALCDVQVPRFRAAERRLKGRLHRRQDHDDAAEGATITIVLQ